MKLENNALQELYDTIINYTLTISPFAESPIDTAFRECDDALKALQDRNDLIEKSNGAILSANMDLASKNRKLEKEIEGLDKENRLLRDSRDEWSKRSIENRKQIIKLERDLDDAKTTLEKANEEKRRSNAKTNLLREQVKWHEKRHVEQAYKIRELESELNSMYVNAYINMLQDIGYDQGYTECFIKMCADMMVVDYPERFRNKKGEFHEKNDKA